MPRVIFRGLDKEGISVSNEVAEVIRKAKSDKINQVIDIDGTMFETKDIKFVKGDRKNTGKYLCENNCGAGYHMGDEVCSKSYTGSCVECGKKLWERDRDYAVAKWGKMFCRAHSPFGKAGEALGVAGQNDSFTSTMIGMVSAYIEKGKTVEEALDSMQDKINKLKWKKKQTN